MAGSGSRSPGEKNGQPKKNQLRQQVSELIFALPDNRIGWRKNAVRAGLQMVDELQPSVVFATGPPFTTLVVGAEIARRSGLPLVLDFRDPWTRVPWGPRNKSWVATRVAERFERRCVRQARRVVLNTSYLEQDFVDHYGTVHRHKFVTIPNGYDPKIRQQVDHLRVQAATQPTVGDRAFHILHPGSLYRQRDPRQIVDAMAQLKDQGIDLRFEQLGRCDPSFRLADYVDRKDLSDQVRVSPGVSHRQMLEKMARVDAFLLLQPGTALQVPGKLFEMILFRKPIVAICAPGAISDLIEKYGIGVTAQAGDIDGIATAFRQLVETNWASEEWDAVLDDYDARHQAAQLARVFKEVVDVGPSPAARASHPTLPADG